MNNENTTLSRRTFLGGAAALAVSSGLPHPTFASTAKPDSKFHGVQFCQRALA